jgi:ABC-2 type transport system ATP-binding protein
VDHTRAWIAKSFAGFPDPADSGHTGRFRAISPVFIGGKVLEVQELTKYFGRRVAVDGVTFKVNSGEIVGYLGPNGAGKSTTVKMLVGMLRPSRGRILINGRQIERDLVEYKMRIGYVPEEAVLYSHLSGCEYLQLGGRLRGIPEGELTRKIDGLLSVCLLYPYKFSPIISYSKGMKQKIMMLAALLHNPDILILDEAFSGLDVSSVLIFRKLLKSLASAGKAILFSSHVLEIIEKICDRVLIIHQSHLVADDSVEHLRDLMHVPSLEEIFQQLVQHDDYDKTANDILGIISN